MKHLSVKDGVVYLNGQVFTQVETALDLYKKIGAVYPKFFKMDPLCKWAWLGAECLLIEEGRPIYESINKEKIAVVLFTRDGCLEIDKVYLESMKNIASPALFVYTLPNIMLGEICIRHGFEGEQLCEILDEWAPEQISWYIQDLLENRNMEGCLFGWINATSKSDSLEFYWCKKEESRYLVTENLNFLGKK